ncbi:LPXTG cell wall anchor domain-containing protein [Enterococcus faecalis]|uniref:LPXTG cell wall anchor domain-containing protein n=1 Tax=Enterococcus faecalis TaxID=1351 RepID=UPI001A973DE5|nr:LPXTG cell wall anchor domain-containing protein [Enterococcus faecalis]MBO1104235.1 LPXTG cell wall anchor domain-containing protein [Enterococcus faecalis]
MKKWVISYLLCGAFVWSNVPVQAQQENTGIQTETTVQLTRPIQSGQLPGVLAESDEGNKKKQPEVMAQSTNQMRKLLPKTNEQQTPLYSVIGGSVLVICSLCFLVLKKKREEV